MSKIKIAYAPNTFQVLKHPEDETQDLYLVANPDGYGGGIRAIVLEGEMNEIFKDKFLEFLN